MSTGGGKRSAVGDGGGDERPAKKSAGGPGKAPTTPTDSRSEIGANVDLLSKISLSMNTGEGLYELCVAVGPKFASRIRHDYLLKSEKYLVKSLETLHRSLPTGNTQILRVMCDHRPKLDKCRDNIRAWMKVNTEWRSRCTESNLAKYKGFKSKRAEIEANLVFNHPALIVELGLVEILRHLVEGFNINLTKKIWEGVVDDGDLLWRGCQWDIAYQRSDVTLLNYLMSAPSFDWKEDTGLPDCLYRAIINDWIVAEHNDSVTIDCFTAFIAHPKVNVNAPEAFIYQSTAGGTVSPLACAVSSASQCGSADHLSQCAERVLALLEAGADPHVACPNFPSSPTTPLDMARTQLRRVGTTHWWPEIWRKVVHKMEE